MSTDTLSPPQAGITDAQRQRDLEEIAAVLSHELSDPLREAVPLCQMEDAGHRIEGVRQVQLSLRRLALLRQYMQLGQLAFPLQPYRLQPVMQMALARLRERLQRFPAQLQQKIPPDASAQLNPEHAATLLALLIDNALIYNPSPHRKVAVAWGAEGNRPYVSVIDNGPGMDPACRHIIFRLFLRLDPDALVQGHGVGLSFARRLAELHKGEIQMFSEPGQGTEMRWWLPAV